MSHRIQDSGASPVVAAYLDALQERRRTRFRSWVTSVGGQKEAVEKLDKSQAQVSHLMTGKKSIGESLARDLEHRARLPFGWLDEDEAITKKNNITSQDAITRRLLTIWNQLPEGEKRELAGMAAGLLRRPQDAA